MLSIIIPTKNREDILSESLLHLKDAVHGMAYEVIIINDGENKLNIDSKHFQVISNNGHGAASARNSGAKLAHGDLLLFLDDDIIVNKENIKRVLDLNRQHLKTAFNFSWKYPEETINRLPKSLHGRFILNSGRHTNRFRIPEYHTQNGLIETHGLSSQFFSISKVDFEGVGGYDDRIPLAGVEDIVLAEKLKKGGVKVMLSMDDWVIHNEEDRLTLDALISRFRSGAKTVKVANELGYKKINLGLSWSKHLVLRTLIPTKKMLLFAISMLPNNSKVDWLYARLVSILLASATLAGYSKK